MPDFPALNLVIAHKLEAQKLLQWFSLERVESDRYQLYRNSAGMQLIVSGMGFEHARAATEYLASKNADSGIARAWLNIGIAGHQTAEIGSCFSINKIIYRTTGQSNYPALVLSNLASTELVTVDEPELSYPHNVAYDMEASGYWQSATNYSSLELVQCIKMISDNRNHSTEKITDKFILSLFEEKAELIIDCCRQLQALTDEYNEKNKLSSTFQSLLENYHFTVTQQNQLKRLCQRYQALGRECEFEQIANADFRSSKELLGNLSKGFTS